MRPRSRAGEGMFEEQINSLILSPQTLPCTPGIAFHTILLVNGLLRRLFSALTRPGSLLLGHLLQARFDLWLDNVTAATWSNLLETCLSFPRGADPIISCFPPDEQLACAHAHTLLV
jgi:hypothetical protein